VYAVFTAYPSGVTLLSLRCAGSGWKYSSPERSANEERTRRLDMMVEKRPANALWNI